MIVLAKNGSREDYLKKKNGIIKQCLAIKVSARRQLMALIHSVKTVLTIC